MPENRVGGNGGNPRLEVERRPHRHHDHFERSKESGERGDPDGIGPLDSVQRTRVPTWSTSPPSSDSSSIDSTGTRSASAGAPQRPHLAARMPWSGEQRLAPEGHGDVLDKDASGCSSAAGLSKPKTRPPQALPRTRRVGASPSTDRAEDSGTGR